MTGQIEREVWLMAVVRSVLLGGCLLGALGSLAFALPAHANDIDVACALTATMNTSGMDLVGPHEIWYVPPQNPITGGTGQTGTYTLSNGPEFECTGRSKTTGATAMVFVVTWTSSGAFENFLCGTGTATSSPGQTTVTQWAVMGIPAVANDLLAALDGAGYSMTFVGDQGTFKWGGSIHSVEGNTSGIDGVVDVGALSGGCTSFPLDGTVTGEFSGSS